jgi:hypothetical protein
MTAVRLDLPAGLAGPVWLAYTVRAWVQAADPRPLRVEPEDNTPPATQPSWTPQHAAHGWQTKP